MLSRAFSGLSLIVGLGSTVACTTDLSAPPSPAGGANAVSSAGSSYGGAASNGGSAGALLGSAGSAPSNPITDPNQPSSSAGADGLGAGGSNGTVTLPGGGTYQAPGAPDFGPNVLVFDPTMGNAAIQSRLDTVFAGQEKNQFGAERVAYFFKPGNYDLNVQVGFYTHVIGLGSTPDAVTITGAVSASAKWFQGNATQNFWRLAENFAVKPTAAINPNDVWAVSQATALRRVHVVGGGMNLFDPQGGPNEWASGGFIVDSKIDGTLVPGSQQQFLTRNVSMAQWVGGVWNMVFVGNRGNPSGAWPASPYTFVDSTPVMREKPYLTVDGAGKYQVIAPTLTHATVGTSWESGPAPATTIPLDKFYVARADRDSAASINAALDAQANVILTPGVYHLQSAIRITRPGTIFMGLGLATLIPDQGNAALEVADVDSVTIAGVLLDAGAKESPTLLRMGSAGSRASHVLSPSALFDVSCRVGGVTAGLASTCVIIDSNDVLIDNAWLWRADHGNGVGWDVNKAKNGLIVNGDRVTAYGLFVEHFEEYQTLWNGQDGRVYFYQSEIPYDVPSQDRWMNNGKKGYASLKLADSVTRFDGRGLGIYCFFDHPVQLETAIESPTAPGVSFSHIVTQWFKNAEGSGINHIINDQGGAVSSAVMGATY